MKIFYNFKHRFCCPKYVAVRWKLFQFFISHNFFTHGAAGQTCKQWCRCRRHYRDDLFCSVDRSLQKEKLREQNMPCSLEHLRQPLKLLANMNTIYTDTHRQSKYLRKGKTSKKFTKISDLNSVCCCRLAAGDCYRSHQWRHHRIYVTHRHLRLSPKVSKYSHVTKWC